MSYTALISGITGQDGLYLAELLLEQGYRVAGMTRRSSTGTTEHIAHLVDRLELVQGDLLDQASIVQALRRLALQVNVCSGRSVSIRWVLEELCRRAGVEPSIRVDPALGPLRRRARDTW